MKIANERLLPLCVREVNNTFFVTTRKQTRNASLQPEIENNPHPAVVHISAQQY